MSRFTKIAVDNNGAIKSYMVKGEKNPCGCGSNCYHYIANDTEVLGICNACNKGIYEVKEEYVQKQLEEEIWKVLDKPEYY